jgi:hypothetical protein
LLPSFDKRMLELVKYKSFANMPLAEEADKM